ncbi:MAG: hypothetical protein H6907_01300 [Hyphomicrobiales bacterium]|nr:hypothetical protein [Hyphomicrobiales bacterium]MCP5370341.1 hypothetical protein [Hyphomicrobiales bacterium]
MTGRPARTVAAVLAAAWLALASAPAAAQNLNLGGGEGGPIEIFADDGIEWQQDNRIFVAQGNARAVRDDVEVHADTLKAYYREVGGKSEIWRLDASGQVRILSTGETAYGDLAVFDVDQSVLVLTGRAVRFVTAEDEIRADRQLEYWTGKRLAVARGNAVAKREGKTLRAQVLAAYMQPTKSGGTEITRVEAFDDVRIVTERDDVTADRGVYNLRTGMATLTGAVKLKRGGNVLNGCRADVNLNTGISRLRGCDGKGRGRVSGTLRPEAARPGESGGDGDNDQDDKKK